MSCTPPLHIPACFHTWTDSHVIVFGTSLYRFTSKDAYFYMINRSNTYLLHGEFSLLLKYSGKGITQNNMHIILPETCTNGKIASMPSPRTPSFLCPFQHQYSGLVSGPSKISNNAGFWNCVHPLNLNWKNTIFMEEQTKYVQKFMDPAINIYKYGLPVFCLGSV